MTQLEPCPHCHRHVKLDETACPFCARPVAFAPRAPRILPRAPIGRAALFAFGVLTTQACGDNSSTPDAAVSADAPADGPADAPPPADADPEAPDGGVAIYAAAPTTPPTTSEDPNASSAG